MNAKPQQQPQKTSADKLPGTDLTTASGVPSFLADAAKTDSGLGVSTDRADNIVPLIYVLQPLSPQVDESSPAHIAGAKPGAFWLRNAADPMVPGDTGILVQPIHFMKDWGEWVPRERGGGLMGRHDNKFATEADVKRLGEKLMVGEDMPATPDATFATDPVTKQKKWTVKRDGAPNDLVHTRNHAVRVIISEHEALNYVIPLKGTGHGVSKEWMGKFMVKRAGGQLLPSFACLYRLTTRQRTNAKGKWWQITVADAGYVTADQYRDGKALYDAFESGAAKADAEDPAQGAGEAEQSSGGKTDEQIPF